METRRLFDEDAYVKDFQATVISIEPQSEASFVYDIVLDQTAFFPEEGGQSADTGRLGAGQVQDIQIKDGVITHQVLFEDSEKDLPKVGDMITGSIQWDRRYTNMQNHTGEHIFSGIVHSKFGFENVGFHLSDNSVTMDYNGMLTEEDVRFVEAQANAAIYENIEVRCEYPDRENLAQLDYRSKKELSGAIRIVTIPGVDVCACCAPHVHRTGEVGMLKVIGFQKYKGGTRLEIRCGWRALQHYRDMLEQLQRISQQLSAAIPQIPEYIERLMAENRRLAGELREVRGAEIARRMQEIPAGQNHVFIYAKDIDSHQMRQTVNELVKEHGGYCGVFSQTNVDNIAYIIGAASMDCREVGTTLKERFDAKGGGKAEMIQGAISGVDYDTIEQYLMGRYSS
ncbi:MAG: hypothetical protein K6A05_01295 [Lachnospiraceae bacterium]|nr:hypothetical protein [Lachnospiraceae bacterium]